MDRIQQAGEGVRADDVQDRASRQAGAKEPRTLADLELMLVGGGEEVVDWG